MSKRIAVITGGMGGLGEVIAAKMDLAGYQVVVTHSLSNKGAPEWLATMARLGHSFKAFPIDVADYDSCAQCVSGVVAEVGPVDILVNNAGITRDHTFRK